MSILRTSHHRAIAAGLAGLAIASVLAGCSATSSASPAADGKSVTLYTADGLNDGDSSFYKTVFKDFKAETGITVNVVEAGSGEVVQRAAKEQANTQADVLVTLPPFIQQADQDGLLTKYTPKGSEHVADDNKAADGTYTTMVDNVIGFIRNSKEVPDAPTTWKDLLDAEYKGKLQYSTPGVAGDGTAMLLLAQEALGKQGVDDYMEQLQQNNVGPSDSTGALAAKVDKGELLVANGDVQMNLAQQESMPNLGIFFLDGKDGKPTTMSVPYVAGLVKDAPHAANAKKLLDYLYSEKVQEETTTVAGGLPARDDVEPTGEKADTMAKLLDGVTVLRPDWDGVLKDLDGTVDRWNKATGSL
ncbi:2-aminoethylphosphonate ABC transporter substrate-binding protein [Curtobacterium pusillum]|uniref:2-aminoethylphosphonate ABC transporter substrate-binding protein n=1 Tax=Curtobacterium pusillum TaxID=69373 RepID=A0AAW3T4B9_9MICO|nr:2-aminoethylphosphonate ABC transporter substrate-binding protein [Curtobacterium pusillum]MBA8989530.1 2-aminoethylphosphonate transport system substrate-binding protein [Curtobacterium pusillum]NUU14975.1 2-aminoethylphosphonate ABC transporter substrate-binding protein [Curtobacterium pusillum]GLK32538.1 2-aminoethylphosphonate ABC transporter substrate-binding protein [Curtobacterium pusillum]